MKYTILGILLLVGTFYFKVGYAAEKQSIDEIMNQMYPHMAKSLNLAMTTYFEILSSSSTAEQLANYMKNYFDALVSKGFSREEALQIIISVGTPVIPITGGAK